MLTLIGLLASSALTPVTVRPAPWANPPGGAKRSVYLHAEMAAPKKPGVGQISSEVGGCGVEVLPLSWDGLEGESTWVDNVRPRAVVSGTLYVKPQYRRQGIAQRLLCEAEGQARRMGCDEMMLLVKERNAAALKLYQKMGYFRCKQTEYHGDQVCMRKHLFLPSLSNLVSLLPQRTTVN